MLKSGYFRFGAAAVLGLLMVNISAQAADANSGPAVAQVVSATGDVRATNDRGVERTLTAGDTIYQGDSIVTGSKSRAHLRFIDEAELYLRQRSTLKVAEYHLAGKAGEKNASVMDLVRGGMRTVTGSIGGPEDDYRLGTQVATMGVRGTDYVAIVCTEGDCPLNETDPSRNYGQGLYTGTVFGAVYVDGKAAETNIPREGVHRVASAEAGATEVDLPAGFYSGEAPAEAPAASCWQGSGSAPCAAQRWPHYR